MAMTAMTGDDVKVAFAARGYDVHKLARIFDVDKRTIWRWQSHGAPLHATLAIEAWLSGEVPERGVKYFLKRVGRTRNDGGRYGSTSSGMDRASA